MNEGNEEPSEFVDLPLALPLAQSMALALSLVLG